MSIYIYICKSKKLIQQTDVNRGFVAIWQDVPVTVRED